MNDPAVIEWLESEEGNDWRRKNLAMKNLLVMTVKEDYDNPWQPQDVKVAVLGWIPETEDDEFALICSTGDVPVPDRN